MLKLDAFGMNAIHAEEGCVLHAYQDRAKVWTIGWGHTGPEVREGLVWTRAQADAQFDADVTRRAVAPILKHVRVLLTQGQFDALVSLVYNIGGGAFAKSTLLRKLNLGDFTGAAAEFNRWCHSGGTVDPVLVRRRARERKLFEQDVPR